MPTKKQSKKELPKVLQPAPSPQEFLNQQTSSSLTNITPSAAPQSARPKDVPSIPPANPSIIRSGDTGAPTGVTLPTGQTFGNLPPGHAQSLASIYNERRLAQVGTEEATDTAEQVALKRQLAAQSQAINTQDIQAQNFLDIEGRTPLNTRELFLSTIANNVGSIASKTGAGIAGGKYLGGGYGALAGGIGGFALGVYESIKGNAKTQVGDNVQALSTALTEDKQNMQDYARLMAVNPSQANEYAKEYNTIKARTAKNYAQLLYDTNTNINLALTQDGTRALQEYKSFYAEGGEQDRLDAEFQLALIQPDFDKALEGLMISRLIQGIS